MKNYFNKQERQDLLTLEAARASFDRLIGHDLIPEPDKDRLRIAKLSLDNALPDIAERVPESLQVAHRQFFPAEYRGRDAGFRALREPGTR